MLTKNNSCLIISLNCQKKKYWDTYANASLLLKTHIVLTTKNVLNSKSIEKKK